MRFKEAACENNARWLLPTCTQSKEIAAAIRFIERLPRCIRLRSTGPTASTKAAQLQKSSLLCNYLGASHHVSSVFSGNYSVSPDCHLSPMRGSTWSQKCGSLTKWHHLQQIHAIMLPTRVHVHVCGHHVQSPSPSVYFVFHDSATPEMWTRLLAV